MSSKQLVPGRRGKQRRRLSILSSRPERKSKACGETKQCRIRLYRAAKRIFGGFSIWPSFNSQLVLSSLSDLCCFKPPALQGVLYLILPLNFVISHSLLGRPFYVRREQMTHESATSVPLTPVSTFIGLSFCTVLVVAYAWNVFLVDATIVIKKLDHISEPAPV